MDLLAAKSRVAQALVESIFRRARYTVTRFNRDLMQSPLRFGRENFSPDFVIRAEREGAPETLVEVKYRPSLEQFLSVESQRGDRSALAMARRQWPNLVFVLVTDRPEPGRSCFQALVANPETPRVPLSTVDLAKVQELEIFDKNVEDHEQLVRSIMSLLSG